MLGRVYREFEAKTGVSICQVERVSGITQIKPLVTSEPAPRVIDYISIGGMKFKYEDLEAVRREANEILSISCHDDVFDSLKYGSIMNYRDYFKNYGPWVHPATINDELKFMINVMGYYICIFRFLYVENMVCVWRVKVQKPLRSGDFRDQGLRGLLEQDHNAVMMVVAEFRDELVKKIEAVWRWVYMDCSMKLINYGFSGYSNTFGECLQTLFQTALSAYNTFWINGEPQKDIDYYQRVYQMITTMYEQEIPSSNIVLAIFNSDDSYMFREAEYTRRQQLDLECEVAGFYTAEEFAETFMNHEDTSSYSENERPTMAEMWGPGPGDDTEAE